MGEEEEEELLRSLELMFKDFSVMTSEEKLEWLYGKVCGLETKVDFALSWILGVPRREVIVRVVESEEELEKRIKRLRVNRVE